MILLNGISRDFLLGDTTVHALSDINLEIGQGDYMSIMGPSGSGKSTLLNIIALLDRPSKGSYVLNQKNVIGLHDEELAKIRRENIGFVFQFFHLIHRLTAAENVGIPLILSGIPPQERRERVEAVMESFGLAERTHHKPDQLSGGERQRVAICRAMIMHPTVILADEPTGNLDQATGRQVIDLLEGLNKEGVTLIVVTHDVDIGKRARRRLRLVDGRIVEDIRD
ncbi:MAG TPA: ABC transporter ATP-binding protein [Gammaproteobacteria bacterium]